MSQTMPTFICGLFYQAFPVSVDVVLNRRKRKNIDRQKRKALDRQANSRSDRREMV
jgi:hypothetical protein